MKRFNTRQVISSSLICTQNAPYYYRPTSSVFTPTSYMTQPSYYSSTAAATATTTTQTPSSSSSTDTTATPPPSEGQQQQDKKEGGSGGAKPDGFTLTDEQKELARKLFKTPIVEKWEDYNYDPAVVEVVNKIIRFDAMQLVEITKLLQFKLKLDETSLFKSFGPMAATMGFAPMGMMGQMGGMQMQGGMQGGAQAPVSNVDPKKQQQQEEAKKKADEDKKKAEEEKERIKMANQSYMATLVAVDEASKFKVLKEIRKIIPGMKLLESKEMVDKLPSKIKEVNKDDGDKMVALFKELGGTLELKVK